MPIDHPTTQTSAAILTYGGTGPLRVTLAVPGCRMYRGDFIDLPARDLPALIADLQRALDTVTPEN